MYIIIETRKITFVESRYYICGIAGNIADCTVSGSLLVAQVPYDQIMPLSLPFLLVLVPLALPAKQSVLGFCLMKMMIVLVYVRVTSPFGGVYRCGDTRIPVAINGIWLRM